nr:HAT, C-terminal dimerization domain containing protein [Ipomoea batatas]
MNALVYILYNKKLKDRHLKLKSLGNDEDNLLIDELPSDDEWLTQPTESSIKKASASAKGLSKGKKKLRLIDEDEKEWEDIDHGGGSRNEVDEAIDYNDSSNEVSL